MSHDIWLFAHWARCLFPCLLVLSLVSATSSSRCGVLSLTMVGISKKSDSLVVTSPGVAPVKMTVGTSSDRGAGSADPLACFSFKTAAIEYRTDGAATTTGDGALGPPSCHSPFCCLFLEALLLRALRLGFLPSPPSLSVAGAAVFFARQAVIESRMLCAAFFCSAVVQ